MKRIPKAALPSGFTFLSGCLVVATFSPWKFWPLVWVCLVPWFWELRKAKTLQHVLIQSAWLSFFFGVFGCHWVSSALHQYGDLPWGVSFLGLLIYSVFCQPQFYAFGVAWKLGLERKEKREFRPFFKWTEIPMWAFLYVGCDWLLPKLFSDTIGLSLFEARYLRQCVDITGVYGLSFLVVWVNLLIDAISIEIVSQGKLWVSKRSFVFFCLTAILCLWVELYGYNRYREIQALMQTRQDTVTLAAIQANIGDFDKIAAGRGVVETANRILDTYFELSEEALRLNPKPDVIVWPETAYPTTFRSPHTMHERRLDQRLEYFVREKGVPLIFGGYDQDGVRDYNALFFFYPFFHSSADLQVYRKNILLMFGEYIPGAQFIRYLRDAFPQVGNFGKGIGAQTLTLPLTGLPGRSLRITPAICYEGLFSSYALRGIQGGSDLLLNVTNDSWFGRIGEPELHLQFTAFRAIETRVPLLRVTNTGFSAYVSPTGDLLEISHLEEKRILTATLPLLPPVETWMKTLGDWFGPFSLVLALFYLTALLMYHSHQRRS